MNWLQFDRAAVRGAIEEATGQALSVDDPLPDTLIAHGQHLGLLPIQLRIWIYEDQGHHEWTAAALARWARRNGFTKSEE